MLLSLFLLFSYSFCLSELDFKILLFIRLEILFGIFVFLSGIYSFFRSIVYEHCLYKWNTNAAQFTLKSQVARFQSYCVKFLTFNHWARRLFTFVLDMQQNRFRCSSFSLQLCVCFVVFRSYLPELMCIKNL